MLISGKLLGRDHENGEVVVRLAEEAGELVAVHFGHHDVQHHKVNVGSIHFFQGFLAVGGGGDSIASFLQEGGEKQAGVLIVVYD